MQGHKVERSAPGLLLNAQVNWLLAQPATAELYSCFIVIIIVIIHLY